MICFDYSSLISVKENEYVLILSCFFSDFHWFSANVVCRDASTRV